MPNAEQLEIHISHATKHARELYRALNYAEQAAANKSALAEHTIAAGRLMKAINVYAANLRQHLEQRHETERTKPPVQPPPATPRPKPNKPLQNQTTFLQ